MSAERRQMAAVFTIALAFWLRYAAPPVDVASWVMMTMHSRVHA